MYLVLEPAKNKLNVNVNLFDIKRLWQHHECTVMMAKNRLSRNDDVGYSWECFLT